ncbi:MAG: STAS domain-containing protein, partial [Spirochaetes bacterium]|nr:STAS domain-containing protein [Spirochaetota bacterium]
MENDIIIIQTPKTSFEHKDQFADIIDSMIKSGCKNIKIDLSKTMYLASDFLGLIMWKKEELSKQNISLTIIGISDQLRTVFQNLKLMSYFNLE